MMERCYDSDSFLASQHLAIILSEFHNESEHDEETSRGDKKLLDLD